MKRQLPRRQGGCCRRLLRLREENARFVLLAVVLLAYMILGALLFRAIEGPWEVEARERYDQVLRDFWLKYNGTVDPQDVVRLLEEHANASSRNLLPNKRPRWDFVGSFYFVGTVVSTIGFGMTTPCTWAGRSLVLAYGFLGCSGAILFFNLFLERIITLLACLLKALHERELRRRGLLDRRDSQLSFDDRLDDWKPSVYWVMLCLFLATAVLSASASVLYARTEQWGYLESFYFCFVAFSTIGFGDLVPGQKLSFRTPSAAPNVTTEDDDDVSSEPEASDATGLLELQVTSWYHVANFLILSAGCCCIYSLFNVTSIVIKQFLNWLIRRLDCSCRFRRRTGQKPTRYRRNALTPAQLRVQAKAAARSGVKSSRRSSGKAANDTTAAADSDSDADSTYDSDNERGHTGELICMSDLLRANKVSLAIMQKQLYETAQRGGAPMLLPPRALQDKDAFKPGSVGPLAIVSQKFGDGNV
ncbi:potassium channel subfamily K member 12 [Rhipicephalus sanguineus]|uniref:potassium channel subfamily K member 12 n=1 Tax=Rhipicephalus sanguineus TaxID=34632 RepID=UPI0018961E02|nr:potassium channel subfamily K member 12 [Rhipicephalus sanguineus]